MAMICPQCSARIAMDDVNVREGVALCRACQKVVRASALLEDAAPIRELVCPRGAWDVEENGQRRIGATTRSPLAFYLVPFMCVWSGGSLGGIYGTQIRSGHFNVVSSLFGIPFILGSLLFWGLALMHVAGRVEVRLRGREAEIFTGVGPFGRTQRFHLSEFTRVGDGVSPGRRGSMGHLISLEGSRRLTFGSLLNNERRYFLVQSLKGLL